MSETKMLHIRFPVAVVEKMTTYLKDRGLNRNRFVVEAVVEKLRREMQVRAFKETQGVLTPEDAPEWAKTTGAEWVRALRGKDKAVSPWDI